MEEWREVKGASTQKVSSKGNITGRRGRLVGSTDKNGYVRVKLVNDEGIVITDLAHRVVYKTFIGNIIDGYDIHHIDGNPSNNSVSNLKMVTHYSNLILDKGIGISTRTHGKTWRARYKNKYMGTYKTKSLAVMRFIEILKKNDPETHKEVIDHINRKYLN